MQGFPLLASGFTAIRSSRLIPWLPGARGARSDKALESVATRRPWYILVASPALPALAVGAWVGGEPLVGQRSTFLDIPALSANLGAVATLLLGGLGLFSPSRAAAFTSLAPIGRTGVSEIRATYGGLFAALGLVCLALQSIEVFSTAGAAWVGAAAGRAGSVLIDRNRESKNLGGIVFELALGLLLLAPWLSAA